MTWLNSFYNPFKTQSNHSPLTSTSSVDFAMTSTPSNSSAKELWVALTPNSKKKSTLVLKEESLPGSVKSDVRKDFGLNLSRDVPNHLQNKTNLALVIKNFFQRPDIVQICTDVKEKTKNPSNSQESNQIHFQLEHFKTFHKKFISKTKLECAYSMFTHIIPYYVRNLVQQIGGLVFV